MCEVDVMDRVIRGIMQEGKVRVFFADVSESCREICEMHGCTPVVSDALSRVLSVGAIMGTMQKDGKLTIKIDSCGPVKLMLVDANADGNIRGFVANPVADINLEGKRKVSDVVGELGVITVIKDLGMKQKFSSQIELQTGEIGEDFSMYFRESEQVPSLVAVGSKIGEDGKIAFAGGLIIQLMPGADDVDFQYVENLSRNLPPMHVILETEGSMEDKLQFLIPELEILGDKEIHFVCNCSKEKIIASIATLNVDEILDMINENKDFETRCEFCSRVYNITKEDLEESLKLKRLRYRA